MGRRRKENRGIYRWSRPAIGAIATVGALGTAYLTVIKLMGNSAACPVKGCDQVLTSAYADVFGIPLTLFGCLAYLSMVALSLGDRKSTRLNSSHPSRSRMPSSA